MTILARFGFLPAVLTSYCLMAKPMLQPEIDNQADIPSIVLTPSSEDDSVKKAFTVPGKLINLMDLKNFSENSIELISTLLGLKTSDIIRYLHSTIYIGKSAIYFSTGEHGEDKIKALIKNPPDAINQDKVHRNQFSLIMIAGVECTVALSNINVENNIDNMPSERLHVLAIDTKSKNEEYFKPLSHYDKRQFKFDKLEPEVPDSTNDVVDYYRQHICDNTVVHVKAYLTKLSKPETPIRNQGVGYWERNVEMEYLGRLESIYPNGYRYKNYNNGEEADLDGFVDEIRFTTKFENDYWRFDEDFSLPTATIYDQGKPTVPQEKKKTIDEDFGARISGSVGGNIKGLSGLVLHQNINEPFKSIIKNSLSLEHNQDTFSVLNRRPIACEYCEEHISKEITGTNFKSIHQSRLMLNRVGSVAFSKGQSRQIYEGSDRSLFQLLCNLFSFERSLNESNKSENPLQIYYHYIHRVGYPYTSSDIHKPFYKHPERLLPEKIRTGVNHAASLVFYNHSEIEPTYEEEILPLVEVDYHPGLKSFYIYGDSPPGYRFSLTFLDSPKKLSTVSIVFPRVHLNWLDRRVLPISPLAIQYRKTKRLFIKRSFNDRVYQGSVVKPGLSHIAGEFLPEKNPDVFYLERTSQCISDGAPIGPGADCPVRINSYSWIEKAGGIKQIVTSSLGVTESGQLRMIEKGKMEAGSRIDWLYRLPGIFFDRLVIHGGEFTLCLRTRIEGEHSKCLVTDDDGDLRLADRYDDSNYKKSQLQWNLVNIGNSKMYWSYWW